MKIFTTQNGKVDFGAKIETYELKGGTKIPAILVGEPGRGRKLGMLPVHLVGASHNEWLNTGETTINFASIGTTKTGAPKLYQALVPDVLDECLIVARAHIGFRGRNKFTGDRLIPSDPAAGFTEFPGKVICEGVVAQGAAGAMGSGKQLVFSVPKNVVWRVGYGGKLYGGPESHYFNYNEKILECMTWNERVAVDTW